MTFLCGENTTLCGIQDKQAKDAIISKCLNVLRMLFPEEVNRILLIHKCNCNYRRRVTVIRFTL